MKALTPEKVSTASKALEEALLLAWATKETIRLGRKKHNAAWPTRGVVKSVKKCEEGSARVHKLMCPSIVDCYRVANAASGDPKPTARGRSYACCHEAAIHELEMITHKCREAVRKEAGHTARIHALECFHSDIDFTDLRRECAKAVAYVSTLRHPDFSSATESAAANPPLTGPAGDRVSEEALHPTAKAVAKQITENPGVAGKNIATAVGTSEQNVRRLISKRLLSLGYHNVRGQGYFPPEST